MQVFAASARLFAERMNSAFDRTPEALDAMADHIARFSLAGIRDIARGR
jgi:hypothetical protein